MDLAYLKRWMKKLSLGCFYLEKAVKYTLREVTKAPDHNVEKLKIHHPAND